MSVVYKLGGTSQCKIGYDKLIEILKTSDKQIFIVLSAVSGVTNNLVKFTETKDIDYINKVIELNDNLVKSLGLEHNVLHKIYTLYDDLYTLAKEYIKSFEIDDIYCKSEIIGYGEILSTNIFNIYINTIYIDRIHSLLNSYDYIFSKKEIYQCNSSVEFYASDDLNSHSDYDSDIYILQGFIASTPSKKKIVLGRGGSDTTGALISKTINASYYEVWTDVDGIYTGDPRIFKEAYLVHNINYDLVQELSAMGAKVMHPLSIKPCADVNIPIFVKNTFSDCIGTKISNDINSNDMFYAIQKSQTVFKITSLDMWNSYGFITDIFRRFSENRIDVNIVTTSQFSISATTSETNKYKLLEIQDYLRDKYNVMMIMDCSIFSFVTKNIKNIFNKFNFKDINSEIIHISDNNMTVNIVIKEFYPEIINNIYNK